MHKSIQIAQVENKYNEAIARSMKALDFASNADTDESFRSYMEASTKAAKDAETWKIVLDTLNRYF